MKGDSLTVSAEGTFADSNAAKGKNCHDHKACAERRIGRDYILADNGQQTSTTADISPKEITVTAGNKNKIAGKADPVLTYTAKGLVGKDTLSGITVRRKAGEKVGIYPITVSQASGSNQITGLLSGKVSSRLSRPISPN